MIFYIKTIIAFFGASVAFIASILWNKNKELKKVNQEQSNILNNVEIANKISQDNANLNRDQLIDKL
jgi:hypothetical protein